MKNKKFLVVVMLALGFFFYGVVVKTYTFDTLAKLRYAFVEQEATRGPERNYERMIVMFEKFGTNADFVFIGDSNTQYANWNDFVEYSGWSNIFPNLRVANRGIPGDQTSDILLRMDSILSTNPRKAFIQVGINDIHASVPILTILENYKLIVDALLKENIEVVIQSTIQCGGIYCTPDDIQSVNSVNRGLILLAQSKGVDFLSLGELSAIDGLSAEMTYDGDHLSPNGYHYWTTKILQYLKT